ncbi:hypothetical protein GBA52_020104, partial [Prunus armeniaca]
DPLYTPLPPSPTPTHPPQIHLDLKNEHPEKLPHSLQCQIQDPIQGEYSARPTEVDLCSQDAPGWMQTG